MPRGPFADGAQTKRPDPDELFKKFDANGDGVLSKEEFAAGMKKLHERLHPAAPKAAVSGPGDHAGPPRPNK